jgi:hypothetical protein
MAYPTYIGKGTFQSTTVAGGTTPSLPASIQNGDLLIAVVSTPNDTTLVSTDGDWTLLATTGTGTVATAGAVDVWVFYAIYNGVALGTFSTSVARLKCQQVYAFRNAAVPTVSATGLQTTAATAWTLPSITTTRADSFVFFAIGNDRDTDSTTNVSGYTNSNLANITELHDQVVSTGVGGGIATIYAEEATPSSIGTTSATSAASNTAAFVTFAIATPVTITADGGTYTYSGGAANLYYNKKVTADTGTFSYTGGAAGLLYNRKIVADSVTYSYSGTAANTLYNRKLVADGGTFSYSGTAVDILAALKLIADSGSFGYNGTDASLLYSRVFSADSATYSYVGGDATLTYGTVTSYTLTADAGSFSYSGNDANITVTRTLTADSGTFSYSGGAANLLANLKLTADSSSYSYNGIDVSLLYSRKISADAGSFSYSGGDATLTFSSGIVKIRFGANLISNLKYGSFQVYEAYLGSTQVWGTARPANTIIAETTVFSYTGGAATLFRGRKMTANGTSYTLTGTAATLKMGRKLTADSGVYTITGGAATLSGLIPNGFTYTDDVVGTGTVQASLQLASNGTAAYSTGAAQSWYAPATTNIGASYWAELVAVSGTGTMSGSALSTRIQISGEPQWILTRSTLGVSSRTFTLNIYNASTGGSLLSSGTVTLTAESS